MLVTFPKAWRRFGIFALSAVLVSFVMLAIAAQTTAHKPRGEHIVTFDAPGAGAQSGQGTIPRSINSNGEITGEYYDQYSAVHGFLRTADGSIKTFDVPGASKPMDRAPFLKVLTRVAKSPDFIITRARRRFTRAALPVMRRARSLRLTAVPGSERFP